MPKGKYSRESVTDRFWRHVLKSEECWTWIGLRTNGYGRFSVNTRFFGAHRISWEMHYGVIPRGLGVLHHCDVRNCVRPDHLFLGTSADNAADRDAKGRGVAGETHPSAVRPDRCAHGDRAARAELTWAAVNTIRQRREDGESPTVLAAEYRTTTTNIRRIVRGETWRFQRFDVDKRAILDHFRATGEIVPGVNITRGERLSID